MDVTSEFIKNISTSWKYKNVNFVVTFTKQPYLVRHAHLFSLLTTMLTIKLLFYKQRKGNLSVISENIDSYKMFPQQMNEWWMLSWVFIHYKTFCLFCQRATHFYSQLITYSSLVTTLFGVTFLRLWVPLWCHFSICRV